MKRTDAKIRRDLAGLSGSSEEYWSFRGRSKRSHCHGFIQYPAMMVPEMQSELINVICANVPSIQSVFDPFVGSGTTLGEASVRGLDFRGIDINPLAILACETKSDAFYLKALGSKINSLTQRILSDKSNSIDHHFIGIDKWFLSRVIVDICRIRRSILKEESKWARRFFWVSLSDTVRSTCNSRPSTYKLHIKDKDELDEVGSPISIFLKNLDRNFKLKTEQYKLVPIHKLITI